MDIGTQLTLKKSSLKDDMTYRCKIIDYDDNYLYIDYPIHQLTKKTAFFQKGNRLNASYIGHDDAIYKFQTEIMHKVILTVPALAIKHPHDNIRRIQRRQFVRVNTAVDIAVYCVNESFRPFVTVTVDLSGGGLSLILPKHATLSEGQHVKVWMVLQMYSGKYEYIKVETEVIRVYSAKNSLKVASVKFMSTTPHIEQLMIQYCLEKQREERKKELM